MAVGWHYFPPGLQLPFQSKSVTAHWPVPNYTAWWQRHMRVSSLPKTVTWKRTRNLLYREWTLVPLRHTGQSIYKAAFAVWRKQKPCSSKQQLTNTCTQKWNLPTKVWCSLLLWHRNRCCWLRTAYHRTWRQSNANTRYMRCSRLFFSSHCSQSVDVEYKCFDVAFCVFVCLDSDLGKNRQADQDAICSVDWCEPQVPSIKWDTYGRHLANMIE